MTTPSSERYALFKGGKRHDDRSFYTRPQCRKAYGLKKGETARSDWLSIRKVTSDE